MSGARPGRDAVMAMDTDGTGDPAVELAGLTQAQREQALAGGGCCARTLRTAAPWSAWRTGAGPQADAAPVAGRARLDAGDFAITARTGEVRLHGKRDEVRDSWPVHGVQKAWLRTLLTMRQVRGDGGVLARAGGRPQATPAPG
jgi:hypothetical protein